MPSSYTSSLRLTLPATGELGGQWGSTVNTGITELLDAAVAGTASISTWGGAGVAYTLSSTNGAADEARKMFIVASGSPGEAKNVICPAVSKFYVFRNDTTGGYALTLKTGSGTGISVPAGQYRFLYCDGTNVVEAFNSAAAIALSGNLTLNGGTANGVLYLNGSKVATSGSALVFDGTNFSTTGTATATKLVPTGNVTAGNGMYLPAANEVAWSVNGSERMRLTSTGLGIGTSSPVVKLDVNGRAKIDVGTYASGYALTLGAISETGRTYQIGMVTGDNLAIYDTTAAAQRVVLDSSGNLGLGVTPTAVNNYAVFDMRGRSSIQGGVINFSGSTGTAFGGIQSDTNVTLLAASGARPVAFYTNGAERAVIDASGNLGLGVTPSAWATYKAFDIGRGALVNASTETDLVHNAYWNGTNWIYKANDYATHLLQINGQYRFFTAPSGTAGNAITFTQAMTLDASGNLGVGETAPSAKLDLKSGSVYLRLDPASESTILTNGATALTLNASDASSSIRFRVAGNERARITSGGDFLVGTTDSSQTTGAGVKIRPSASSISSVNPDSTDSTNTMHMYSTGAGAYRFYVGWGGTISATNTTISAISDQRFKENIRDLDVGLNAIMALKPRKFDWKAGKGKDIKDDRGFIAQEFEQIFPDLIDEWKDPAPDGEEPYKSVRQDLIPVLVKAIQEQQAIITDLRARVAALEKP